MQPLILPRTGSADPLDVQFSPGLDAPLEPQCFPLPQRGEAISERWLLRERCRWIVPRATRLSRCGRVPFGPGVTIGQGWMHGIETCGSVWSCPVCSARIRRERAAQVALAVRNWSDAGGTIGMLTLTVRHHTSNTLVETLRGVAASYRRMWEGRGGKEQRQRLTHYIRAVDVTWGESAGWHPHLHILTFQSPETELDLEAIGERWASAVSDMMGAKFRPKVPGPGAHYTSSPSKETYILKLGLELSDMSGKGAAEGHYTHWQIARLAAAAKEFEGLAHEHPMRRDQSWRTLWVEWVRASKGRRHLTWSRGAKKLVFDVQGELDVESGERPGWVAFCDNPTWKRLTFPKSGIGLTPAAIREATTKDVDEFSRVLGLYLYRLDMYDRLTLQFSSGAYEVSVYEITEAKVGLFGEPENDTECNLRDAHPSNGGNVHGAPGTAQSTRDPSGDRQRSDGYFTGSELRRTLPGSGNVRETVRLGAPTRR